MFVLGFVLQYPLIPVSISLHSAKIRPTCYISNMASFIFLVISNINFSTDARRRGCRPAANSSGIGACGGYTNTVSIYVSHRTAESHCAAECSIKRRRSVAVRNTALWVGVAILSVYCKERELYVDFGLLCN